MATNRWRGDSPAIAQVDTLTVGGTVEVGDLFLITINGKTLSVPASSTSTSTTATDIATAFNASTIPEFNEITAAAVGSTVTLTADTAGKPFTTSVSTTEAGGGAADAQTFTRAATTANSGPNNWDVDANWSLGTVPVNADDVFLDGTGTSDILYGLAQSAVTLTSLNIAASYTGKIGLPDNTGTYNEYRSKYLAIGATTINIGSGPGFGSGQIKLDTGSVQTTLNISGSANSANTGLEAILWKGTHPSNVVNITKGTIGVAVFPGETATIATVTLGYQTNLNGDASFRAGTGVTLTTINQSGGSLDTSSNITTLTQTDGQSRIRDGTLATLNLDGGKCIYQSTGTLGAAKVGSDAKLDFSQDMRSRTVSACDLFSGGEISDPFKTVTWTAGINLQRCSLSEVRLNLGTHHKVTPAVVS